MPSLEGFVESHLDEAGFLMGLALRHAVKIGADDRRDRGVAAAGHAVTEQRDRLDPAGHLDRPHWIAAVDHVGRIAAGAMWWFAIDELDRRPAIAVSDAVGIGGDRPGRLEESSQAVRHQAIAG